jgi:hypothetical protein
MTSGDSDFKQRRANTSLLPRSHRVTSFAKFLPPSDDENEQPIPKSRSADHDMASLRRGSGTSMRNSGNDFRTQSAGLGISLTQLERLTKVDEWLDRDGNHTRRSSTTSFRNSTVQPQGPRKQTSRRVSVDPELVPQPLAGGREQPTTPYGKPRMFDTPEVTAGDLSKSPEQLIDEMLDDLYRDQAKSLSKKDDGEVDGDDETELFRHSHAKALESLAESTTTPTRRVSTTRPSSLHSPRLSRSLSQSSGFAPSPSRHSDPFHPSPLRVSRKPLTSPPRITVNSEQYEPTDYKPFSIHPERNIIFAGELPKTKPPSAFGYRIYSKPGTVDSSIIRIQHERSDYTPRPRLYFFDDERESILQSVLARKADCKSHKDCFECFQREFAYFENKAMPTNIPPEERAKILAGNRSLRTIKTVCCTSHVS